MDGGAYQRYLPAEKHEVETKLKRVSTKHLQLRTRIKRLARKTICFQIWSFFFDLVIVHQLRLVSGLLNLGRNHKLTTYLLSSPVDESP